MPPDLSSHQGTVVPTSTLVLHTLCVILLSNYWLSSLLPFRKEKPQKPITTEHTMGESQIIYTILMVFWMLERTEVTEPERHSQECQGFCRDTGQWGFLPNKAAKESSGQEPSYGKTCGLWINQLVINFLSLGSKATLSPCSVRRGTGPYSYITSSASCTIWSCASRGWWRDIKVRTCRLTCVLRQVLQLFSWGPGAFPVLKQGARAASSIRRSLCRKFKTLHLSMGGFSRNPR